MGKAKIKPKLMKALITDHALRRFKERWRPLDEFDEIPGTDDEWFDKFREMLLESTKVHLDRVTRVKQMLNNNFEKADFFKNFKNGLQFVVIQLDSSPIVKTVVWKGHKYVPEDNPLNKDDAL